MKLNFIQNQKGFVALMTVLMIVGIVLAIGVVSVLRNVSEMKMGLQKNDSSQAYYLANLCTELALMKLKENKNYGGNETVSTTYGQCAILPIEGQWTVKVSATSTNQVKKLKIIVNRINPKMIIDSWEEVADF